VVFEVTRNEKEDSSLLLLKTTLLALLEVYDKDNDRSIGIEEFDLLMANPETGQILRRFDVDASGLLALRDAIFEYIECPDTPTSPRSDRSLGGRSSLVEGSSQQSLTTSFSRPSVCERERKKLSFGEFIEVILRLRGGKSATVTDIMDLREYTKLRIDNVEFRLGDLQVSVDLRLSDLHSEMSSAIRSVESSLEKLTSALLPSR